MLTEEQARILADLRSHRLQLEAYEFACDSSVRRLRWKKRILEFLGIALAIGVLFVLYILGPGVVHDIVSQVATGLSLLLIVMSIWGLMSKWDQQIETKAAISADLNDLVEQFQLAEVSLDEKQIRSCHEFRLRVEKRRKHETAEVDRIDLQLAHQHVACKYSADEIECGKCRRKWRKEFASQNRLWLRLPWKVCSACGVRLNNEP